MVIQFNVLQRFDQHIILACDTIVVILNRKLTCEFIVLQVNVMVVIIICERKKRMF